MADFRLSSAAQADIVSILGWTYEHHGELATLRYERLLVTAFRDIASEPLRIGSVPRPKFGIGVCSFHLRNSRERARHESGIVRQPRHFILYRSLAPNLVGIGRILYDAVELERHLPASYGDE